MSQSSLEERFRELCYREKWLCLFTSSVISKRAADRFGVRRWSTLLAQSEKSLLIWVWLKCYWSRAQVDWERKSSCCNAVLFTLRSSPCSSSSSWCLVSSSFICISSSSLLRSKCAFSSLILVSFSISSFFILSSRLCFAEDVSETFSVSWPLVAAPLWAVWTTGLSVG